MIVTHDGAADTNFLANYLKDHADSAPATTVKPAGRAPDASTPQSRLIVGQWLSDRGIAFTEKGDAGRTVYAIDCPFNPDHRGEASITQHASGAVSASCFHNSCSQHGWAEFKEKIGKPGGEHYDPPLKPSARRRDADVDISAIVQGQRTTRPSVDADDDDEAEETPRGVRLFDPGPLPDHLLRPAGFIGEFVDWCTRTAPRPQPELALGAALATISMFSGRLVRDITGIWTNCYILAIAPTASGKEHPRHCVKLLAKEAGMQSRLMEGVKSGTAITAALTEEPCRLLLWDEIGHALLSMKSGSRTPPHLQDLKAKLLSLYTSAGSVFVGEGFADRKLKPQTPIHHPSLNLFASTTQTILFESLDAESVHSGMLNRPLFLFGQEGVRLRGNVAYEPPPQKLIEYANYWRDLCQSNGIAQSDSAPDERVMKCDHKALACLESYIEVCEDRLALLRDDWQRSLRGRQVELAKRLAMLHLLSRYPAGTEIDLPAMEWGIGLTEHCAERLLWHASTRITTTAYEAEMMAVIRYIDDSGRKGVDRSTLLRKFRSIKAGEFDKLLAHAIQAGDVDAEHIETQTKSRTIYRTVM